MKNTIVSILLLLVVCVSARAGGILAIPGAAGHYIFPTETAVTTSVHDQVSVTVVRGSFTNTTGHAVPIQYLFPTGVNAAVSGFHWWIGGHEHAAAISGKPQDTAIFAGGGGGPGDAVLAGYLGTTPFIFPFRDTLAADSTITIELTYLELLKYRSGTVIYHLPLSLAPFGAPAERFSFSFKLESGRDLVSLSSTSFPEIVFEKGSFDGAGGCTIERFTPNRDLDVAFIVDQKTLGVTLLSTKPAGDDGYFIMLAEPSPKASDGEVLDKTFTFVIDVSGSMGGTKIAQAKAAARYTISHLNGSDRFNIIKFSDRPSKLFPDPVPATAANVDQAGDFINGLSAGGGTDLQGALLLALGQTMSDSTSNVILFLTDGLASLDQERVQHANTTNTRIFVFGIGQDVDSSLLTQISARNNGLAEFVGAGDVDSHISDFYNKIRNPLLQDLVLTFSAGDVFEIYPLRLPDLYVGEQLVVLGRYRVPGSSMATVSGRGTSGPVDSRYPIELTGDSAVNIFIPKIWARYKIDALLVLMSGVAASSNQWKEWREEIVRLSTAYGILTPFSSFTDPGPVGGGGLSAVEETEAGREEIALRASPNPFTSSATISFTIPPTKGAEHVVVSIYDLLGNLVTVLVDADLPSGREQQLRWDGRDTLGADLPAGVYLCEVSIGGERRVLRLVLDR